MTGGRQRSQWTRDGSLTDPQQIARAAAGMAIPAPRPRKVAAKPVAGIVALECERCGCVVGRVEGAKDKACPFCGHRPKAPIVNQPWPGGGF